MEKPTCKAAYFFSWLKKCYSSNNISASVLLMLSPSLQVVQDKMKENFLNRNFQTYHCKFKGVNLYRLHDLI